MGRDRPFARSVVRHACFQRESRLQLIWVAANRSVCMCEKNGRRLPAFSYAAGGTDEIELVTSD